MSRHPEVKWAQRVDKVFLTVSLPDAKDAKVNVDPEGVFTFSGSAGAGNNLYELKLELLDKINVEESKISIGVRSIVCILEKAEPVWWKKLLRGDGKPPHYVKVDWDKWVDEDEDTGPGDADLGGMDFSSLGGMGGMGGMEGFGDMMGSMGGAGGMGGLSDDAMAEFDDSDDEVSKPAGGVKLEEQDASKSEGNATVEKKEATPST